MKTQLFSTKLIVSLVLLLMSTLSFSQQGINYQGVARDANNEVIVSSEINLKFNINKTMVDGETVYSETHTITTSVNGVFSVVLGQGIPVLNTFEDVNWAEYKHFLNVWLNGAEIGTTEFMSVPYTQAIGKWQAHKNGVTPKGTGGSIYIGDNAGEDDDLSNNNNIGFGLNALNESTTGNNNVAIGQRTLKSNRDGYENIAIGIESLHDNISGDFNIGIGSLALYANISGDKNIAIGDLSLYKNSAGSDNIALGRYTLYENITGNNNVAIGNSSLYNNTIGEHNVANGSSALFNNNEGGFNTAIGYKTLYSNTEGEYNVANGYQALYNNTSGNNNIALGSQALFKNTTGTGNIAAGLEALNENREGNNNVALGNYALEANVNANENVAVGSFTLRNHISGKDNVAIGRASLAHNIVGSNNTAIGTLSGYNNTGSGNVFIGQRSGQHDDFINVSNTLIIDNTNSNHPFIYGEFDNEILAFDAKVGIGTMQPISPLQVKGGTDTSLTIGSGKVVLGEETSTNLSLDDNEIQARNNGAAAGLYLQQNGGNVYVGNAIVHASDKRLKRDIKGISYGLFDILKLRPTEYFWKDKKQEYKSLGLIAQEVEGVIENVVTYDKAQDKYGVSYTELIPVLIKAIQEQNKIIEAKQLDIKNLKAQVESFESRLGALEGLSKANN